MSKTLKKSNIVMPSEAENRRIIAAAKSDADAQPLTEKQLKTMVPMKSLRGKQSLVSQVLAGIADIEQGRFSDQSIMDIAKNS